MKPNSINPIVMSGRAKEIPFQTPELVIAAEEVLEQGLRLLDSSAEKYSLVAPAPFAASIGQHYRHVLEHFHCLLEGAASGEVNYDSRKRNPRIENEIAYAGEATREVINKIQTWDDAALAQRCSTVSSLAYHSDSPSLISSNLGRELAYCIGHAIHHFAIIRLLCSHVGVEVPADFGYAPSTLKYQSSMAAD